MTMIPDRLRRLSNQALALNRSRDLKRAQSLLQSGRYEDAARVIDRVLGADPRDQQGRWLRQMLVIAPEADRAQELWNQTRRLHAKQVLLQLAQRCPDEPEIHLRLAPMLIVEGLDEEAAEHARRAAVLAPNDPNTLFRAAEKARWGDREAARGFLAQAKSLVASGAHPEFEIRRRCAAP